MRARLAAVLLAGLIACCAWAQAPTPPADDPLLDRFVGRWVLEGSISGRPTTHDVNVDWVLAHQYLRIHEVSRERNDKGDPRYEAIVFVAVDRSSGEYTCLWLDTTNGAGLAIEALGRAKGQGDSIPFVFKDKAGSVSFTNTFTFDRSADSWAWTMDNVTKDVPTPFARLKLKKAG